MHTRNRWSRRTAVWAQVAALLVLSPICAEFVLAYDSSTGRPLDLLSGLVLFAPLYGGPALLIREVARRTGRGWPSMLLLAAAFGIVQAGVIDQSLFNDSYQDVAGWNESMRKTYIGMLGVSASNLQAFVLGHVVQSFGAPIALVEAMRPATARVPWLGRRALAVVALLYVAAAAVVMQWHLATESLPASPAQVAGTLAVAGAFTVTAFAVERKPADATRRPRAPRLLIVLVVSLAAAMLYNMTTDTWAGVAVAAAVIAISGLLLHRASRGTGWSLAHTAAVAAGLLLVIGLQAFTYYPVIGEVSAARKYSHNVAMLLLVATASWYAVRRARNGEAGLEDVAQLPPT